MKSVLLSIQPKWCELIVSGKKTIEVRKTAPQHKEPFKVYIYQTRKKWIYRLLQKLGLFQGKVIGEFVCDRIDKYESEFWDDDDYMSENHVMEQIRKSYYADPDDCECEEEFEYITGNEKGHPDDCELCWQSCLTYSKIRKYIGIGDKTFYGWHISDLKIYDTPKALGEFKKATGGRTGHPVRGKACKTCPWGIVKVPQSWCYVEKL